MVATDDKVGGAIISSNDGVPERFPGPCHPHREWQQAQHRSPRVVVFIHQHLVNPYARVVIDITGFSHPDNRMN